MAVLLLGGENDELTVIRDALFAGSASFSDGAGLGFGSGSTVAAAPALRPLAEGTPGRAVSTIGRGDLECDVMIWNPMSSSGPA
jgi:hypothetical protein